MAKKTAKKRATKTKKPGPARAKVAPKARAVAPRPVRLPVQNPPAGYHTLTPHLIVRGGAKALAFYAKAFGARELYRLDMGGGKIGHAEMVVGDSPFMLADEFPEMGFRSPHAHGGTPVSLIVSVPCCDKAIQRALAAGASLLRPVQDHFYGDRAGTVVDPFGHVWTLATHIEDVAPDEIARRAAQQHDG